MNQIIGSLLKELSVAKTISDASTTEIAKHYKENELLRHFPIPRMTIHDVEIDLKFAIDSSTESAMKKMAEDTKKDIMIQISNFISSIPKADFSGGLFQHDDLRAEWNSTFSSLMDEIKQVFPATAMVEPEKLAAAIGSIVELFIYKLVLQKTSAGILGNLLKKIHQTEELHNQTDFLNIKEHVADKIKQIITDAGDLPHTAGETMLSALNILVEASELEPIPLEKLHSIKLKLSSADRQLVKIEKEDRTILASM